MPNCWYIHVPIVGEFRSCACWQELLGRSAIFPPSSAPRHVLNCAWMDGECLACGDNGYLYMFQAFFGCTEMEVSWNGGTPKSSILIGFSIANHPFGGTPVYGTPQIGDNLGIPMMRKHFFKLDNFTEPREQRPYDMDKSCCNFPQFSSTTTWGSTNHRKIWFTGIYPPNISEIDGNKQNHCNDIACSPGFWGFLHHRHHCWSEKTSSQGTSASCSQRIATAALGFAVQLKNKELLVASKDSVSWHLGTMGTIRGWWYQWGSWTMVV